MFYFGVTLAMGCLWTLYGIFATWVYLLLGLNSGRLTDGAFLEVVEYARYIGLNVT